MLTFIDTTTLSFYISFLGVIGMISMKSYEIRSGRRLWISKITDKTNRFFTKVYFYFTKLISYMNRKSAIALIQWIAYYILSWARETYIWAHKKAHAHPPSRKVIDMVRGRGEIKRNGGSSFFLKRISEVDEIV